MAEAHDNTIYVIVPNDELTDQMVDDACETSLDTLRHTVSGDDLVLLKWVGDTPASLEGYTQYTHSEIMTELSNEEWGN